MKTKIIFLSLLSIFIACQYSYSKTINQVVDELKFDTLKVVTLKNNVYRNDRVRIIDLKDIEKSIRRIVLNINKEECLLCDLDQSDYNGFSVDKIRENLAGFEISIEYGSRIYWNKTFFFEYRDRRIYLSKIQSIHFDKYKISNPIKSIKKCNVFVCKGFNLESYLDY